jgi:hypothetical protein
VYFVDVLPMRAAVVAALLAAGPAAAEPTGAAGGQHIRLATERGPVHVWLPPGYRAETAGVALYVHGYYTGVDRAWREHRLAEQFRASGRNAMFIAPEAPAGAQDEVSWPVLGELLVEVRRQTGLRRPWGPVVVLAHSGGYRTAMAWLEHRQLEQIVLVDALYGEEAVFRAWLEEPGPPRQLILVGGDTVRWTEPFVRELAPGRVRVFDRLPERGDLDEADRRAPLLYFRSQYSHMGLVEDGRALPILLRLTRLERVRLSVR